MTPAVLSLIGSLGAFVVLFTADPLRKGTWAGTAALGALLIVFALVLDATTPALPSMTMHG